MGTFTSVLGTLTQTLGAIQTIGTAVDTLSGNARDNARAQQRHAMDALIARQNQAMGEAQQKAATERKKIELDAKAEEDRRRAALKRAMAKRNAAFGASNIAGGSGSREAVLLGLYNESEEERKQREELDKLRFNVIDTDLSNLQSRNILTQTQLAEQQRLQSLGSRY